MNICLKCSIDVYLLFDVKIQTLKHKKDSALFPENVSVFFGLFPVFFKETFSGKKRNLLSFKVSSLATKTITLTLKLKKRMEIWLKFLLYSKLSNIIHTLCFIFPPQFYFRFLQGEGLQLMNLMLREKKKSRTGALR